MPRARQCLATLNMQEKLVDENNRMRKEKKKKIINL